MTSTPRRLLGACFVGRNTGGTVAVRPAESPGDNPHVPDRLKIALAQVNPTVGDVEGNAAMAIDWIGRAADAGADLVVLPELCLSGYPPEDLLLRRDFVEACREALEHVASAVEGTLALVGFPEICEAARDPDADPYNDPQPPPAHNSLAAIENGRVLGVHRKVQLPNYGVFDERRYFEPGDSGTAVEAAGVEVGMTVCEDIWVPGDPEDEEAAAGVKLIANASASPYNRTKGWARERLVAARARSTGVPFALCNTVGGQDELVFDGRSVVVAPDGEVLARAPQFEPGLLLCEVPLEEGARVAPAHRAEPLDDEAEVYGAVVLGTRDYVRKNGFEKVVLGLSGGIDSALVATVAVDALGAENVRLVIMPSPHSSDETQEDARAIARNLGIEPIEIEIDDTMRAYERALAESFEGAAPDVTEENLQARIRGNLLMALSNKFGWLVLTTGNKSELSVGYSTLYGDMAGGFAPLKDVLKTLVYRLVRHRNERAGTPLVPAAVIDRPPTAELRPGQSDQDSLPPYDVLDEVIEGYVERDIGAAGLVAEGHPAEVVREVIAMIDRAEYKRRQAPPGVRVTSKAFGRDRRLPITNRFTRLRRLPR
jgi:NAD+ synthase (glutamine-hydrolysing)